MRPSFIGEFMRFYYSLLLVHVVFPLQRAVDDIVYDAIVHKIFSGASIIVGGIDERYMEASYGSQTYDINSLPISQETLFDLASLTKIVGTTMMTLVLYEEGKLKLDDCVSFYIPLFKDGDKDTITIKDLLTHVSGVQPDEKVENIMCKGDEKQAHAVLSHIVQLPLICKPHIKVIYSCLNFYLLAHINELIAGEAQEEFLKRKVFEPLVMSARYHLTEKEKELCASTAKDLQGIVHDPLARFYGFDDVRLGLIKGVDLDLIF
ncbi:MAG: hypothetical protein US32_C0015G0018 [candidate division TM6 bacterium GW2011_GWA2_36_9]|nr:MAG: hypothetical protein US32_C0015G0018 [candidate division TM6 bacterium GW2011_GWA2_36_9]